MKIISWNVNSLKIRHDQLVDIINKHNPDVISLQETSLKMKTFQLNLLITLVINPSSLDKKFNGVAIITKLPYENVLLKIPNFQDEQKRFIYAEVKFNDRKILLIMNGYFPNGQSLDSDKFIYKQSWVNALLKFIKTKIQIHY